VPAVTSALGQPDRATPGRPPLGLLDVVVPWPVIGGRSSDPAVLGRIGPITRWQARLLIYLGASSAATQWRVILTDDDGCAVAVEQFRPVSGAAASTASTLTSAVVGRVSITIRASLARAVLSAGHACLPGTRFDDLQHAIAAAAQRAADRYEAETASAATDGGCAHLYASGAYRPPSRLREFVAARDGTCRSPTCGQPAWRGDLDHTVPWQNGGRTCRCNLGGICRTHHKVKQLPGWRLEQTRPGHFRWTTPAGQIHEVGPDSYPI
jgi:hypothetical protein